jgi:hypothetical protein
MHGVGERMRNDRYGQCGLFRCNRGIDRACDDYRRFEADHFLGNGR